MPANRSNMLNFLRNQS